MAVHFLVPSASGSGSFVRWPKGLARPSAAAAIHALRTGCFWRPETALASSPSRPLARVASRSHSLQALSDAEIAILVTV